MTPQETLDALKAVSLANAADVVTAIRGLTGLSMTALAEAIDLPRQSVQQCLRGTHPFPHVRRAIEVEINLPTYGLDDLLDS